MELKLNMFSFVFGFTFLIGVGMVAGKLLDNTHYGWLFLWNLVGCAGFLLIIYIAQTLEKKNEK